MGRRALCGGTREQGFPHLAAQGATYRGGVLVRSGNLAEGLSLLREGSTAFSCDGSQGYSCPTIWLSWPGACEIAGQFDGGSGAVNDALQMVRANGRALAGWPSYIGTKANCCCGKGSQRRLRGGIRIAKP